MSVLKKNIVANFGGSLWAGLMGLVFIPLYINFLGIEAYGLIGIFATLLALFSMLDMGLSSTLNREMARLAVQEGKAQEMRDLVRTLEIPYWAVGILISGIFIFLSPLIAYHWVNAENLSPKTTQTAIMIMGFSVAFQWPLSFYSGGLMGLQRQVLLNCVNMVMATFRGIGAVLILWLVSPTVEAFFFWQIVASVVHIGFIAFFLWRSLPPSAEAPRIRRDRLLNIWRFAVGMTGISITGLLITQIDKIILSKLLSLEQFGYYSFASVVVATLQRSIGPFFSAVYPRFSELVSLGDEIRLKQLYHQICQFLAVVTLPLAMMLVFFPFEILLLWTGNPITTSKTYIIVRLLAIGAALNGLLNIPYALTLSYAWTRITIYMHIVAIILIVPMIVYFTTRLGVVGAPIAWIFFNGCNILITMHIIHARLLKKEKWNWYLKDVGIPLAVALIVASFWRIIIPADISRISILLLLCGVFLITLSATSIATPYTRSWIVHKLLFDLISVCRGKTSAKY